MERVLKVIPFDKAFYLEDGRQELCHATGIEVCMGNPANLADWWNEYVDSNGEYHYGR